MDVPDVVIVGAISDDVGYVGTMQILSASDLPSILIRDFYCQCRCPTESYWFVDSDYFDFVASDDVDPVQQDWSVY